MAKIHIYQGDVNPAVFSGLRAEISFSEERCDSGAPNLKLFAAEEAKKGLEQLKRWVSTGAFKVIAINGLSEALEKGNKAHLLEWIQDHSTEPDFPSLILLGEKNNKVDGLFCDVVDSDGVKKILNA